MTTGELAYKAYRRGWWLLRKIDYFLIQWWVELLPARVRLHIQNPDVIVRYRRMKEGLGSLLGSRHNTSRILDVGSGPYGLSLNEEFAGRVVCMDLSLEAIREQKKRVSEGPFFCADAAMLPLRDDSFDAAVGVHFLEHIPGSLKYDVMRELLRVSCKGVVIQGPIGEHEVKMCRWICAILPWLGRKPYKPAVEHIQCGVPDESFFREFGCEVKRFHNLYFETLFFVLYAIPFIRWLTPLTYGIGLFFQYIPPMVDGLAVLRKASFVVSCESQNSK